MAQENAKQVGATLKKSPVLKNTQKTLGTRLTVKDTIFVVTPSGCLIGASFDIKQNMALQFFSKFRQLASTLDRDCHQLSSDLENSEASAENENRSCLLLREILADTRNLKVGGSIVLFYIIFGYLVNCKFLVS